MNKQVAMMVLILTGTLSMLMVSMLIPRPQREVYKTIIDSWNDRVSSQIGKLSVNANFVSNIFNQSYFEAKPYTTHKPSTTDKPSTTHIMIIADPKHLESFRLQIETIKCYTEAQGLNLIIPSESDLKKCGFTKNNSHLRRHCVQVNLMDKYPSQDYFVLMDADTIAFNKSLPFPKIYYEYDLVHHERWWNGEVQCPGGQRNTPEVKEFLSAWSREKNCPYVPAKPAFSGNEDGKLLTMMMKWFVLKKKEWEGFDQQVNTPMQRIAIKCFKKYSQLNATVKHLDPYWSYVQCARVALGIQGQAGKFNLHHPSLDTDLILADFREHGIEYQGFGINMKLLPRFQGAVVDWSARKKKSQNVVFLHGIKDVSKVAQLWEIKDSETGDLSVYPECKRKQSKEV